MKAPESARWFVARDLKGHPKVPARCRQLLPGRRCRNAVDRLCDRCGKPVCITHIGHLASDHAGTGPEVCTACRALERHYGAGLATITAEQREAFLTSSAAAGLASHDEVVVYPDLPSWPAR